AQLLAQEMEKTGFDAVNIDDMGNVIGKIGSGQGPVLLYYTHLDTVGIGDIGAWQQDPLLAVIENGVLYGRGAADPKGGLASLVYGANLLKEANTPLNGTLYVVGGVQGEPSEGVAIQYLIEEDGLQPDWVVLGAPTGLKINRGQRGRVQMEVTVQGKACHAATPQQGVNAIYGAARIIFSLELMASTLGDDTLLGPGTLAVTHIENIERTKNVIPDRCTFIIDRRLTLGETEAHALAEVQGLIAKEGVAGQVAVSQFKSVSYTGKIYPQKKSYPAWVTPEKDPLIKKASKSAQKITGYKPPLGRWNLSTAGVYTMGYAGIPTIGFGPGEERYAHTANEHVKLQDCFMAARVYAQIAADILS
ncbi:MAG TPA: YgeY family selenium metabolism-linked hydrolase, partial [Anaerolineae bacterium]|nr:YgeY family selenium metabolism-linked hydrolase [Anaerolineae bacterium]